MSKLYFCNAGEIDPTAMLTFGVSAKEKNDAIGKFGTGFKYAVAIILRLGGSIRVISCGKEYNFTTEKKVVRDKEFDVVHMNGESAHFTTHFGTNWEPWMAFRELYCNMLDEEGALFTNGDHTHWDTVIEVESPELYDVFQNKDKYFLSSTPIIEDEYVEVHKGLSTKIFYQGVYVGETDNLCAFTYNFKKGIDLTEERVIRYWFQYKEGIARAVQKLMTEDEIRHVFCNNKFYENDLYRACFGISQAFRETCEKLMQTEKGIPEGARVLLKEVGYGEGAWPEFYLTKMQLVALNRAKGFLKGMGFSVDEYPIHTVTGLGPGVMGRAYQDQIYLSELAFKMGVKQLASTLLEEWVHIKQGCADFDRRMQNWLFDTILSLGEEMQEEIL